MKGKKQYFQAADPQRLIDLLKAKQDRLKQVLPELRAQLLQSENPQKVTVFSGVNGIRSVLDAMLEDLKRGGVYYDCTGRGLFREVMGPYWDLWQERKRQRKIRSYVLFSQDLKKKNLSLLKDYYGMMRFHDSAYVNVTDTMVYKDTVLLLIWTAQPPIAIKIVNKDNAQSYKNQFMLLWRHAIR